jgi:hypothetical protein
VPVLQNGIVLALTRPLAVAARYVHDRAGETGRP